MNYDIERKILQNESLTDEEVFSFLGYFCNCIRRESGIMDPMATDCKVCYDTSEVFGRIMAIKFDCDVYMFDIKKVLNVPITHFANIIFLNVNNDVKGYLVDMTYSQFFDKVIYLDKNGIDDDNAVYTDSTFGKIENDDFVKCLRVNGFMELSNVNIKKYVYPFLEICGCENMDEVYGNVDEYLVSIGSSIRICNVIKREGIGK